MSKKNKEKEEAATQQKEAWKFAQEDRAASRAKAQELSGSSKDRLKAFYELRDKSDSFLKGIDSGKDVKGLLSGELAFRDKAGQRAEMESQMLGNTGSRALMGAPDANFQAQLDSQSNSTRENDYARDALSLLSERQGEAKNDLLNSTNTLNNDEYNIANVLNGNSAQGLQMWEATNKNKQQVDQANQGWFSKYVMPFAQGAAGGLTSYLTGGIGGGKKS